MSRLTHQAETLKLARFLDVEPAALSLLEPVSATDIRLLREQATRAFFANDDAFFKRVVAASHLLPIPLLALVAEKVLGPLLAARIAGQMDVKRGVGIASRLPDVFLADTCLSLDPTHTRDLIRAIPIPSIVAVAGVLSARREHVTMGRFVDILDNDAIAAVIEGLDNEDLLRTAFFAENKQRLDAIVGMLTEQRLVALICTASSDADLWPETLGLLEHLSPPVRGRLADLAAQQDEAVLTSMVVSVNAHGLWGDVLPLLVDMAEVSRARFANLPAVQQPDMLAAVLQAASADKVWDALLPMIHLMDEGSRNRCAAAAEGLDGQQMLQVADATAALGHWPDMIDLIGRMGEDARLDMVAILGLAPLSVLDTLVPALEAAQAWPLVKAAWPRMSGNAQTRLMDAARRHGLGARIVPDANGRP